VGFYRSQNINTNAVSRSFLLNFAYAELQESRKELADVHAMFDRFLGLLRKDLDALESRVNSANSSFSSNASGAAATADTSLAPAIAEVVIHSNNSSFATQSSEEKPPKSKELEERRTQYGLVWIMYMRFARRAENFKASRAVFGKARKDRWTPWETYEAAGKGSGPFASILKLKPFIFWVIIALMEYHCNRAVDVASRIFERGLDLFGDEIEYVLRYLGFLISVNDENS
jgi:cleavage stimulation factor subunit 3